MPTTAGGLIIFVGFLIPGFLAYSRRRKVSPAPKAPSPLVKTATIFSTSLVANALVLLAFTALRWKWPDLGPDPSKVLFDFTNYASGRLGELLLWSLGMLAASCGLAALASSQWGIAQLGSIGAAPLIFDESAWYHLFEEGPANHQAYVGVQLKSGTFVGGFLNWYSTDIEESPDRDLVLSGPLDYVTTAETKAPLSDFSYVVLSSREIDTMNVIWVQPAKTETASDDSEDLKWAWWCFHWPPGAVPKDPEAPAAEKSLAPT